MQMTQGIVEIYGSPRQTHCSRRVAVSIPTKDKRQNLRDPRMIRVLGLFAMFVKTSPAQGLKL